MFLRCFFVLMWYIDSQIFFRLLQTCPSRLSSHHRSEEWQDISTQVWECSREFLLSAEREECKERTLGTRSAVTVRSFKSVEQKHFLELQYYLLYYSNNHILLQLFDAKQEVYQVENSVENSVESAMVRM